MKIDIAIGSRKENIDVPDENLLYVLGPNEFKSDIRGEDEVRQAIQNPIGSPALREIVHPGEKVVIVTSDITRPMPTGTVMPVLLDELYEGGVKKEDITLIFALGSHRGHTEEEKRKLAGERAYKEIKCIDSDPDDCVNLGMTKRGTPVDITKIVAEADRRICLGNIEFHYFAGYSGGGKAIMPGVSTRAAIQANHSMMIMENAHAGKLAENPVREDIEEAAGICGIDYIINVVLNEHKEIVYAVAGDWIAANRLGCSFLDKLYKKNISERADIVVVSQGGAPKDMNLYQTQKALDNAKHAVKKGGTIILAGSCKEGFGEKTFEEWIVNANKPEELIDRIKKDFKLGGHKAAAIAMVLENAEIKLVSDLDDSLVRSIFMEPCHSVQEGLNSAFLKHGSKAKVIVMPYGGSTLPQVTK